MNSTTLDLVKSALKLDGTVRPSQRAGILRFLATMDYSLALPAVTAAPDKFLAPKEAARYLGLSKRTLARYIKAGKIKPSRLNARVLRFKKAELDTFIAGDNTSPIPDPAILQPTG